MTAVCLTAQVYEIQQRTQTSRKAEVMKTCDVTFPVLNVSQFHVGSVPGLRVKTWRTRPVCQPGINAVSMTHSELTDIN